MAFCQNTKISRHTSIPFTAHQCAAAHSLGNPAVYIKFLITLFVHSFFKVQTFFQAFLYPENVGLPIGEEHSSRYVQLEIHYDNPLLQGEQKSLNYMSTCVF